MSTHIKRDIRAENTQIPPPQRIEDVKLWSEKLVRRRARTKKTTARPAGVAHGSALARDERSQKVPAGRTCGWFERH